MDTSKNEKLKPKFKQLISIIRQYGKYYEKKHGNWILLPYIKEYAFSMDSWNENIKLIKFNGAFNNVRGFGGDVLYIVGYDFGGFSCRVLEEQLDCWIEQLTEIYGIEHE